MAVAPAEDGAGVAGRLEEVRARLRRACVAAGRDPAEVRLVAVSKFHSAAAIRAAYGAGQRDFGENYVQELTEKAAQLSDLADLRLRFIGHLQSNKARVVVAAGCAVDTLDRLSLARQLDRHAAQAKRTVSCLVQVNVGREPQKSGVLPEDLSALLAGVAELRHLRVAGLMTIPPAVNRPEDAAPHFQELAELGRKHGLVELSMGMSDDLEVAVAAGATMVRVGTAIFGPRPSSPSS